MNRLLGKDGFPLHLASLLLSRVRGFSHESVSAALGTSVVWLAFVAAIVVPVVTQPDWHIWVLAVLIGSAVILKFEGPLKKLTGLVADDEAAARERNLVMAKLVHSLTDPAGSSDILQIRERALFCLASAVHTRLKLHAG